MKRYIKTSDIIVTGILILISYLIYSPVIIKQNPLPKEIALIIVIIVGIGFLVFQFVGRYLENNFYIQRQFKFFLDNGFKPIANQDRSFLLGEYENFPIQIKFQKDAEVNGFRSGWAYIIIFYLGDNCLTKEKIDFLDKKYQINSWKRFNSTNYSEIKWTTNIILVNIKQYLISPINVKTYLDKMIQIFKSEDIRSKVNMDYILNYLDKQ